MGGQWLFYLLVMINKVAVLIDGGFFITRFKANNQGKNPIAAYIKPYVEGILHKVQNLTGVTITDVLFRIFYYDCRPYGGTETDPNGNKIDFSKEPLFNAVTRFQNDLRLHPQLALRLGELSFDGWKIDTKKTPNGFKPDLKQKSVDMKIGLDIALLSIKKIVDKIVLVAGDSDFIAPMKLARREGILVYLDTMGQSRVKIELREHSDFLL